MTYPEFVQELTGRYGDEGIVMALRAEVGFLRRYLKEKHGSEFTDAEEANIKDFLDRHQK